MDIISRPRQAGKTTEAVSWVRAGESTPLYPFFTRVIITPSVSQAMWLRDHFDLEYNQVYHLEDWQSGRIMADVEVALDNADMMLERLVVHGKLAMATFTNDQPST